MMVQLSLLHVATEDVLVYSLSLTSKHHDVDNPEPDAFKITNTEGVIIPTREKGGE